MSHLCMKRGRFKGKGVVFFLSIDLSLNEEGSLIQGEGSSVANDVVGMKSGVPLKT